MRGIPLFRVAIIGSTASRGQNQEKQAMRPHVGVIGVNGMKLDVIRPLPLKGAMPNLEHVTWAGSPRTPTC
jgi:hypothetical protein